ncbi:Na+/H+ antiporter NhaC [Natronospira proteinivora]|uniref:Na+/H+ antiporter NhaC n=1 Tax=Natronospira proteinivora TaxID=1807133 RepID=A0ABT1G7S2_9GAMM|nr:Na+/H+ antiporter NhaC family protein [Natronospira proteinivora]MCP1727344.1 Na+/H+ antiporter NhaC [Natronospira proteinivora]
MEWLSLLPPLVAIAVAVWKREVIIALLAALFVSETLLAGFNPGGGFTGMLDRATDVFSSPNSTRILLFSLLVGALLYYIQYSGGVAAVVRWLTRGGYTTNARRAGLLPTFTGFAIFIETNMSILTSGIVARGLFDRFKMSRARLAYIIDSTCAPVAILILLNGWGAYILGLLDEFDYESPVAILAATIPLNFYALITLALVLYTVITTRVHGPMKTAESRMEEITEDESIEPTRARYMLLPVGTMIGGILFFLWLTGDGSLLAGAGAQSVLWATALAVLVAYVLLRWDGVFEHKRLVDLGFQGMGKLLPVVATVLLALALGASMQGLGTGEFVAAMLGPALPVFLLAPLAFIAGGIISFTTGTSWGTYGILIPIALPLAAAMDVPPALVLAAVMGGGVFGDHCSPISDTTIISSLGAGCDHLEHVRTQLPYALVAGLAAVLAYTASGLLMMS